MRTVAVDVDGVLADQVKAILADIRRRLGIEMERSDVRSWDEPVPGTETDIKIEIESALRRKEFVRSIPFLPGAREGVRKLQSHGYRIIVATSREPSVDSATRAWLDAGGVEYDDYLNLSVDGKGGVAADILVDDYTKHIEDFSKQGGMGVLFRQPWNASRDEDDFRDQVVVADGWEETVKIIMKYKPCQESN